jgi:hypothetical protein
MKIHYSQLTDQEKASIGDGCGIGPRWMNKLVPELLFHDICNQHDFYSKRGGDVSDYLESQVMFCAHMLKRVNDVYPVGNTRRYFFLPVIFTYFITVLFLNVFFWKWGKYRSLEDIKKNRV